MQLSSSKLSRFLLCSAVLAVPFLVFTPLAFSQQTDSSLVTHTMGVGGVTSEGARFRIRISREALVNVEVAESPGFATSVTGTPVRATTQGNTAVLIDVHGLRPDTQYYYRAIVDGAAQPQVQSFRTFPPAGSPATYSFAFGSCQESFPFEPSAVKPGKVFTPVARSGARFFLQLGDWGYPDTTDNFPYNTAYFSTSYRLVQDAYLFRYDPNRNMDTVLRTMPVDYVYDDHDFMNGNSSATTTPLALGYRPNPGGSDFVVAELLNPVGARENVIRGYQENMPTYPLRNDTRGIYHSFTCGDAEFFMLDLRAQRSPDLEAISKNLSTGRWEYVTPPGHSILGRDAAPGSGESQLTWLLNGLSHSTATWKFLVSSVPFNRAQMLAIVLGMILQDSVINGGAGIPPGSTGIWAAFEFSDKWVGYPADIDTLLKTIQKQGIHNVILLSGDSHSAAMDDGSNAGLPEVMAGGLYVTNSKIAGLFAQFGLNIWNKGGQGITTQLSNNAFGKVNVFGRDSVQLQLIDEEGTLFASQTIKSVLTSAAIEQPVPRGMELLQNYPNPVNGEATIQYTVGGIGLQASGVSDVQLQVFDLLGREIATLVNERKAPGTYSVSFDAGRLASGVYLYRLTAGANVQTRRMVVLK